MLGITYEALQEKYPRELSGTPFCMRSAPDSDFQVVTQTALASPIPVRAIPPAKDDRRSLQDRLEAAERQDILSVGLAQPHRANSDDPRRSEPLGRFCLDYKPKPLGDHCWQAGQRYAEIVRDDKTARGFDVLGWAPSDRGYQGLTQEQIEARKELAAQRKREADQILRGIKLRLPAVLESFVYDQNEPFSCDHGIIVGGLVALALEFGMLKQRFGA